MLSELTRQLLITGSLSRHSEGNIAVDAKTPYASQCEIHIYVMRRLRNRSMLAQSGMIDGRGLALAADKGESFLPIGRSLPQCFAKRNNVISAKHFLLTEQPSNTTRLYIYSNGVDAVKLPAFATMRIYDPLQIGCRLISLVLLGLHLNVRRDLNHLVLIHENFPVTCCCDA